MIRHAIVDDLDAIVAFQRAMARETENLALDEDRCRAGVTALFANPERGRYFVAAVDGEIVGCLMITSEWSDWRNGSIWWIQSVYVAPDFRRRGIYAALYQHIRGLAERSADVFGIRLYVDRRNATAQEVYRRLGMDGDHYQLFEWMKS